MGAACPHWPEPRSSSSRWRPGPFYVTALINEQPRDPRLDITDNRFVYYNYDFANKSMKNSNLLNQSNVILRLQCSE